MKTSAMSKFTKEAENDIERRRPSLDFIISVYATSGSKYTRIINTVYISLRASSQAMVSFN